tara:strand:+ start:632 stop:847 length:216 start_codon:yes stop_codon:yes gene_type:complete
MSCRGSRKYSAGGYNNPLEPGKWGACPYCDASGTIYIEAAMNIIVDFMIDLPQEKYELILQKIAEKKTEEI